MVVGTNFVKTWHLPKELLVKASPFFAAALNGSFAEATSRVVNLPEDNTDAFALFVRWLYVGEIRGDLFRFEDDSAISASMQVYLQASILGDKLGSPGFHDLAMLELIECHGSRSISVETVRVAYEHSAPGSKLRQYSIDKLRLDIRYNRLSDMAASYVSVAKIAEDLGQDFLKACMEAGSSKAIDPREHRKRYMEVLTVTDSK